MNLQLLILDTLRAMPHWLLTWVGGKPQEIDGNRLDMNMQVLAKLSARGSNASDAPPSVDDIRAQRPSSTNESTHRSGCFHCRHHH